MDEITKHVPLHEKWKDYTAEEIVNIQKEQCHDCKYFKQWIHTKGYVNSGYCDYISCTGESRKCSPDGCTKKVIGPPMRPLDAFAP